MKRKHIGLKRWLFIFDLEFLLVLLIASSAYAAPALTAQDLEAWMKNQYSVSLSDTKFSDLNLQYGGNRTITCPVEFELLAKAQPDECFYGLCDSDNYPTKTFPCPDINGKQGLPKVNQAYVWGMTMADDGKIWFGTVPNTHCLVLAGYLGMTSGLETPSYACELGQCGSQMGTLGDWRSPEIYCYDPATGILENHTPSALEIGLTIGIRSAGDAGGVIFLGGPSDNGVKLFAYLTNGDYLGSVCLDTPGIITNETLSTTNIRKWLTHDGVLYAAIGSNQGGRVLKWTGNSSTPFQFEVVGVLDGGDGAELAFHDGRIFVTTWPGGTDLAGLFMGPVVPAGGLPASQNQWDKVWRADDYEPDTITARTYGGGALASFDGYLYWGTMHVPLLSFSVYSQTYSFSSPEESLEAFLGSYRAISIFRGDNFDNPGKQIDLVYGMPNLPVSTPTGLGTLDWQLVPNNMNAIPLFGFSGFGNMFNNYTWSMQVFGNKLWIGTMDWSYIIGELADPAVRALIEQQIGGPIPENLTNLPDYFYGADLFCMTSSSAPAFPLCLSGLGNYTNYGIRNMLADSDRIYFGMANPMNLLTDTTDDLPEGGWELLAREDLEIDGDLVPADLEDQAPNNGDGNGDGVLDSTQSHVASIQICGSSNFITVEVSGGSDCTQIRGVIPLNDNFLPEDEGFDHPFGDMSVMLQCPSISGGSATIRIYYHGFPPLSNLEYRKFGQMEIHTPPSWYTFPNAVFGRTTVGGETVVYADLTLTDNELGDFFLHECEGDGFILDPGGPARSLSTTIPTLSEWGMIITAILLGLTGFFFIKKRYTTSYLINLTSDQSGSGRGVLF